MFVFGVVNRMKQNAHVNPRQHDIHMQRHTNNSNSTKPKLNYIEPTIQNWPLKKDSDVYFIAILH